MKDMKVIIGLLAVLTVFVTCVMLKLGPNVFIPLVIAWFLSYMMSPAVVFLLAARSRLRLRLLY